MKNSPEILIVGGGVIGLTTAWNLAREGVSVTVADRSRVGKEASWAGAGMLPPGCLKNAHTPEAKLRSYSHELWDGVSQAVSGRAGIDNGYRRCGAIEVYRSEEADWFAQQVEHWAQEGIRVQRLDRQALEHHVPDLHPEITDGVFIPDFGQVRNPRHLKSLALSCQSLGVEIVEGCENIRLMDAGQGTVYAVLDDRTFSAGQVCVAAGSWSPSLLMDLGVELPVKPIRGQMVQLRVGSLPFVRVIEQRRRYIVPRADGLILVGSTMEQAGFEKKTTADGIAGLLSFAESMVPELGRAELVRCWAGLRPGSPDELPFLGAVDGFENLFVAAGHFRNGLQMSTGTGAIMADLLLGRPPAIDIHGLRPQRVFSDLSIPMV